MFESLRDILGNAIPSGASLTVNEQTNQLDFPAGVTAVSLGQSFPDYIKTALGSVTGHNQLLDLLPDELTGTDPLEPLALTHFAFQDVSAPEEHTATQLQIGLRWDFNNEPWEPIPDLFKLTNIGGLLIWTIVSGPSGTDHQIAAVLNGEMRVAETPVQVAINMPDYTIRVNIQPDADSWSMADLVTPFGFQTLPLDKVPAAGSLADLSVTQLTISGSPRTGFAIFEIDVNGDNRP